MSAFKTSALLLSATAITAIATTSFAQVADDTPETDPTIVDNGMTTDPVSAFAATDFDQDGFLSVTEFTSYVVNAADTNDEAARTIVLSGDYETAFADHDADMDGLLSEDEVVVLKAGTPMETDEMTDELDDGTTYESEDEGS